jgi:hypothetical protein
MLQEICLIAEFVPDHELWTCKCSRCYHRVSGKGARTASVLSGQGAPCHVNMTADKTHELGRVNDLAFNTPANRSIQSVHYSQAELEGIGQQFALPCLS